MKKKIIWMLVSCLIALSLVMASCAPAAVEEEEEGVVVEEEKEEEVEEEVVAPTVEKPKYGGVLKLGWAREIEAFDEVLGQTPQTATMQATNEELWIGDWTKGPAGGYGTHETDWTKGLQIWRYMTGCIAESWEFPTKMEGDTATVIFHIRQGIHWALNPASEASRLVGGRELTADDVVFSLNQAITDKRAYIYVRNPELRAVKITSPAPWTVKMEIPWGSFVTAIDRLTDFSKIVPPEVVAKYGDMSNWRNSVGSGPFMLTDYVPGSTATLVRNPNYWMKDPIGPGKGNQLPYLDGVKFLIIVDNSTKYAALRTGKIDQTGAQGAGPVPWEDAMMLKRMTPQLMLNESRVEQYDTIHLKIKVAPFNDIRVRRALMMAIDFEGIKRDLFGGQAQIITYPIEYVREYADAYLGLDDPEMPASVKELYSYNPEKAKQLLAEAGYPDGFETNMILENISQKIDYYSVIADMWSRVGVDVELVPKEYGAWTSIRIARSFDQMLVSSGGTASKIYLMQYIQGPTQYNSSEIDDPVVNETYDKIQKMLAFPTAAAEAEAMRLHKEMFKHFLDQAYGIPSVNPQGYVMWWPWLKNYSGEMDVGFRNHFFHWVWLDQELKKSMGY